MVVSAWKESGVEATQEIEYVSKICVPCFNIEICTINLLVMGQQKNK